MKTDTPEIESHKPHIVLVTLWRVTNAKGGTEKVFCDMANALSKRGYNITALYCDPNQGNPGFPFQKEVHLINSYKKPLFPSLYNGFFRNIFCWRFEKTKRHLARHVFTSIDQIASLREALRHLPKADLFISFQPKSTWLLRDYLNIQAPIVTMFHFNPMQFFLHDQNFIFHKKAVASSAVLQVLHPEYVKETLEQFPENKISVIPNIAPHYAIEANTSQKTIITVARFAPQKRTTLLLEAFALLLTGMVNS